MILHNLMNHKTRASLNQVLVQFPQMEQVNQTQADKIINYLLAEKTPKRVTEISKALNIPTASTSRTLQELYKGGYVFRPGRTQLYMNDLNSSGKPKHLQTKFKTAYCITNESVRRYFNDRLI